MKQSVKEEYNNEPVFYCRECLSLKVVDLTSDTAYCEDCGSTNIGSTDIDTWKALYKERYKKDYMEENK